MSKSMLRLGVLLLCIGIIWIFACEDEKPSEPENGGNPPGTWTYVSPDSASMVTGPDVELMWHMSPFSGADEYWVYYGPDADHQDVQLITGDTTATISDLYPPDTTYWKIWALHDNGTDVGPTWFFEVVENNSQPISYISPEDGSIVPGPDFDLTWHACTNGTDEFTYTLYLGFVSNDMVQMESTTDTTLYVDYVNIRPMGTLYWSIEATDGNVINYGPIWHFFVGDETMIMPYNPDPPDNYFFVRIDADLSWDYSGPPGSVIYCDVYMAPPYPFEVVSDNQTETTYDPGTLENSTEYFWKIVAFTSPTDSIIGPDWEFYTEPETDIENPVYPYPEDGAFDVPIDTDLSWEYTGNPNDVAYCDVYFGTIQDPPRVSSGQTETTYDPGVLDPFTFYYWKVVAFTSSTDSTVGPTWSFLTEQGGDLEEPVNPDPPNGATSVSITTNLSWGYTGTPEDVIYCNVYLGTSPDPGYEALVIGGTTYDPPEDLTYDMTYYWKIVAFTSETDSTVGPIWSFTTQEDLEIPQNPDPPDGATSVSVATNLSWDYTGTPGDVIYCDVYLGTSQDPGLVSDNLNDTTYDPPGDLEYEMAYYWKIVAFTSETDSTVGPMWSFTTEPEEDVEMPQNPDPPDGATSVSVATNLSWDYTGTPGDVIYCDVYLGTSPDPELVSDNLNDTTYDPPRDLQYETVYYWKIVAFTSETDSTVGPVWSFTTEAGGGQDIYAQFKLTADILFPYFSWDVITARFDSSYAPDGPIDTLQADSVTVNGNLMNWNSYMGDYSYSEDPSLHWLVNGGPYDFVVYGNAQVPDMTLETTWLECSPMITYPTSADTIYNSGFTTTWDGTCAGNVILTFVLNGSDTTDVRIETQNDGEYTFTEADLEPLQGFSGVISEVIILRESYYINEPGYQSLSEVIMWSTHTVTTIIE